jgi:hypothetical protein
MRLAFQNLVIIFLVATLCGCSATGPVPGEALHSKSMNYGKITRLLEKEARVADVYDLNFQRDSTGSKLFIGFSFRLNSERTYRTAIVTAAGINIVQGFPIVWYDDLAMPVVRLEGATGQYDDEGRLFWHYENAHYAFKDGPIIPYKGISGFEKISGGECILVKFSPDSVWAVSELANPLKAILELPATLDYPECARLMGGDLIVFGRSKLPQGQYGVDCLIYHNSPGGYRLSEEIPMPWASKTYDLNAKTGDALMSGTAQMFAGYYRFNIRTKHRTWLGFAPSDDVLFLEEDVIQTLDDAIVKSKKSAN